MRKGKRGRYTLEFKQEAVRLVESGQTMAAAARSLGVVEQTLGNWVKLHRAGRLKGAGGKHAGDCRADGDQSSAGRAGAGDDGARHPGKSDGILRKGPEVKYAFIRRHRRVWPIRVQCRVLGVSVSGYHQHLARRREIAQRRHLSDEALLVHISAAYAENRGAYGWPRIWRQLRAQGIRVGKQRVQRLMQQHGIQARGKRSFRVTTTDSRHNLPIAHSGSFSERWIRWWCSGLRPGWPRVHQYSYTGLFAVAWGDVEFGGRPRRRSCRAPERSLRTPRGRRESCHCPRSRDLTVRLRPQS